MYIHQVWIGTSLMPERYAEFVKQIKKANPQFEHILWDNKKVEAEFIGDETFKSVKLKAKDESTLVNYIRLQLLKKYGGFYIDVDTESIKPLIELLFDNPDFIIGRQKESFKHEFDMGVLYSHTDGKTINTLIKEVKDFRSGICIGKVCKSINNEIETVKIVPRNYFYSDKLKDAIFLHSKYYGSWRKRKNKKELY